MIHRVEPIQYSHCVKVHASDVRQILHKRRLIPGVYLTINGEYLKLPEVGPHELDLKPGSYRLAVSKANQQIAVQRVTLTRGQRRTVRFRTSGTLLHTDATLPIKSRP